MFGRTAKLVCVMLGLLLPAGCGGKAAPVDATAESLNRAKDWYQKGEYDKAIAAYTEAIRLDPNCAVAYHNRGSLWTFKGDNQKAIADYTEAMRLDSQYADALYGLGFGWFNKGEYGKAVVAYSEAIRLDPQRADARAYYYRGNARDKLGEYEKAIADYHQALRLDPQFALPYFSLGQLMSSCPDVKYRDGKKAVENATQACKLTDWKDWPVLDTLAAAYAEAGDFDKAIQWQTKTIELTEKAGKATERQKKLVRYRLELYQAGKPFRQERRPE